ncbi:MAG TPA: NAD-dependent epimerase/dehydratase family protein, partial [Polyangium sp.]|nr:NAD-dependent epimerase/dehydratase family protein [Polyangium sp.]
MRVLIPGISGVLGQRVAKRLFEQGHEVIGIDRRPWRDAPAGIELHDVDIRKRAAEDVFRKRRP